MSLPINKIDLAAVTVSAAATTAYHVWDGNGCPWQSVHWDCSVTGSGIASVTFWAANKPNPSSSSDADWGQISELTVTQISGSNLAVFKPISLLVAGKLRAKFTYVSGTSVTATGYVAQSIPGGRV